MSDPEFQQCKTVLNNILRIVISCEEPIKKGTMEYSGMIKSIIDNLALLPKK